MRWLAVITLMVAGLLPAGYAAEGALSPVDGKALDQARVVAGRLVTQLGGRLKAEMMAKGPAAAVDVCQRAAPEVAAQLSQEYGWRVGRVGTRARNPRNRPGVWQQAALDDFVRRGAQGKRLDGLEFWEVVQEDGRPTLHYARAIATQPMCLTCHGRPEAIPVEVKARLKADYPEDEALGYGAGDLRGAVVISLPL